MHLVSLTLPTVLNHQAAVDLPGYDLFIVHDVSPYGRLCHGSYRYFPSEGH